MLRSLEKVHRFHATGGRDITANYTLVPVRLIHTCAEKRLHKELLAFVRLKLLHGAIVPKRGLRCWRDLVRLGWAREGKKDIYPLPWSAFREKDEVTQKNGYTGVRLDISHVDMGIASLFHVIQEFALRIHPVRDGGHLKTEHDAAKGKSSTVAPQGGAELRAVTPKTNGSTSKRHLQPSPHHGGISLQIMADKFRKTKVWASQMRRTLEHGLCCTYTRRYEKVTKKEVDAANMAGHGRLYRYLVALGSWVREVVSLASPVLLLSFKYRHHPTSTHYPIVAGI